MGALTQSELKKLVDDRVLSLPKGGARTARLAWRAKQRNQSGEDTLFRRSQEYFRGQLSLAYHDHGEMTTACTKVHGHAPCNAQFYKSEAKPFRKGRWPCCSAGEPPVSRLPSADARLDGLVPNELKEMHTKSALGMQLYDCSRQLNHMFSLASAELNYTKGGDATIIRIQGRIHRYCSAAAKPPPGVAPAFAQLYFVGDEQTDLRAAQHSKVARSCIEYVYGVLKQHNQFVKDTLAGAQQLLDDDAEAEFEVLYDAKRIPPSVHKGTMQAPGGRPGHVGVIGLVSDDYEKNPNKASDRAVVMNKASNKKTQRIRYDNPNFDPLHFPLLFPTAMSGWDRLNTTTASDGGAPPVNETCLDFQKAVPPLTIRDAVLRLMPALRNESRLTIANCGITQASMRLLANAAKLNAQWPFETRPDAVALQTKLLEERRNCKANAAEVAAKHVNGAVTFLKQFQGAHLEADYVTVLARLTSKMPSGMLDINDSERGKITEALAAEAELYNAKRSRGVLHFKQSAGGVEGCERYDWVGSGVQALVKSGVYSNLNCLLHDLLKRSSSAMAFHNGVRQALGVWPRGQQSYFKQHATRALFYGFKLWHMSPKAFRVVLADDTDTDRATAVADLLRLVKATDARDGNWLRSILNNGKAASSDDGRRLQGGLDASAKDALVDILDRGVVGKAMGVCGKTYGDAVAMASLHGCKQQSWQFFV